MSHIKTILARMLTLHPKVIDLSLGRIERLLNAIGNPHNNLPPTIHVAGTNGKGSTIAFMRAILESAGLRVHVMTSPDLVRFNERIRLAGTLVSDVELEAALRLCEDANDGQEITYFEITTVAAFYLFAKHEADVLLLETGLGGRLDCSNVITDPLATVITPISIDHIEYLGDSLEGIAYEKAGIIKKNAPVIIGLQNDIPRDVLEKSARSLSAPTFIFGQEFVSFGQNGRLIYQDEHGLEDLPLPKLPGQHQIENAGLAIAALRYAGFSLETKHFAQGIADMVWPGRLARLHGKLANQLGDKASLWLDGGHNVAGGKALARVMADFNDKKSQKLILICSMLKMKDIAGFLEPFSGLASSLIAIEIPDEVNGARSADIAEAAQSVGISASIAPSLSDALDFARDQSLQTENGCRVLICGSLYLAGHVLRENETPPT